MPSQKDLILLGKIALVCVAVTAVIHRWQPLRELALGEEG